MGFIIIHSKEWMWCGEEKKKKKELPDKIRLWLVRQKITDSKIDPNKSAKLDLTNRDFEHSSLISFRSLCDFH